MDAALKKKIMIGIIVLCLGLAVVITVFSRRGSSARGPAQMLCTNPDCGKAYDMSRHDFDKKRRELATGPGASLGVMGQMPPITCPHCGQESARVAIKCKKCEKVYVPDPNIRGGYPDRCPGCGHSAIEEGKKSSGD